MSQSDLVILMGVSGCGKSTLGRMLVERHGFLFLEGDDFHPLANKEKMRDGVPLTDEDRWPWLDVLKREASARIAEGRSPVLLACSALKRVYRDYLSEMDGEVLFVFLRGSREKLQEHLDLRDHEFMNPDLLGSQLETLEEPGAGENVFVVDIEEGPLRVLEVVEERLGVG